VSSGDATGSGDIEIESGSTVTLDGASTDISNVTVKGTLIVANGATLSADKLTLTPTAKVIVKSSASTVSVDKAVGSDTASTFAYEDGAKASNIKIADDSGLKELIPVTGITFDNTALNLVIGKTGTITATVLPANATVKTLTWTTSDAKVATVAAGKVTAIAAGTATITAKADDSSGITATCAVTVTPVYVTGITLSQSSLAMKTGNTSALTATVTPSDATEKTVTWTSSNTAVATVKDGLVTAVGEGTAEITATAGGKSATCKVTVTKDGGGSSSSSGGGGGCNAGFAGLALLAIVPLFCRKKK
jgi:Synergist-CTERM protein sorting domain-containing protein